VLSSGGEADDGDRWPKPIAECPIPQLSSGILCNIPTPSHQKASKDVKQCNTTLPTSLIRMTYEVR